MKYPLASGDNRSVIDTGVADCRVSADVTWQGGFAGLVFRYTDESNWAMFWLDGASSLLMYRKAAGSLRYLGAAGFSWGGAGTTRRLEVRLKARS